MKLKTYIFISLICLASLGCTKSEPPNDDIDITVASSKIRGSVTMDSMKRLEVDTTADNTQAISRRKYIPPYPPKPYKVTLTLPQLEVLDSKFYHLLDSLNTLEKNCSDSEIEKFNLHWIINSFPDQALELTLESGLGKGYKGYFYIHDMLFLLTTDQPWLFRPTGNKKEFVFEGINHIVTEDYSVYLFKKEGNKVILTEAYNLSCN